MYSTYSLVPITLIQWNFFHSVFVLGICNVPSPIQTTYTPLRGYACLGVWRVLHLTISVFFRLSAPITITSLIAQLKNYNRRLILFLLSGSLFKNLLHRNDIAVLVSGLALFAAHNSFAVIELNFSDSCSDCFS